MDHVRLPHNRIRLYVKEALQKGDNISLNKMQANYIGNVMRRKEGDFISLFNGRDGEWQAEIVAVGKREVTLRVLEQQKMQTAEPDIWLIFAPIKAGRIDFLVEKATELGTAKLIPVLTERSIVNKVNGEKLAAYAMEAAEQSERLTVPEISEMTKLETLIKEWDSSRNIILCDESGAAKKFSETILPLKNENKKWAILIGPEGGFTESEFKMLYGFPFIVPVSLGTRILRADTATLAALTLWQEVCG